MLLRCDALVAREAELEALDGALRRSWAGQGPAGVVMGRAGVGKSALTAACLQRARAGAALVGRALPTASTPLRPLTELALAAVRAGADPDTDALRLYGPTLARLLHGTGGSIDALEPSRLLALAAGEALLRLVRGLAPPVVLLLEDLHWADAETLDTVEYLVDHAPAERVAVLATLRDDEPGPAHGMVARTASRHAARVIELGPLGRDHVAEMVAHCVGADASAQLVDEVIARTEGVPLLVEEWLSTAADMGRLRRQDGRWTLAPGHVPVPASLAVAVAGRLETLSTDHQELLVTGALIGRDLEPELLERSTGLAPAAVAAALRAGVEAGLVDRAAPGEGLRYRHALTREAVLAAPLPHQRVATARAALGRLEAADSSAPVVEAIAALAQEADDPHRLARALLQAGEAATQRGALITARERLEASIDAARDIDDDLAIAATSALLTVLSLSGEFEAANATGVDLLVHLEASGDSSRTAALHLAMARAAVNAQRFDEAATHLDRAAAADDVTADALLALTALGQGRHEEAEAAALRALEPHAPTTQNAELAQAAACEALEVLGRLARRRDLDEAERWFRRAATTAQKAGLPVWRARALHELATVRQLRHGEVDALRVARDAAVDAGALSLVAGIDFHLSAVLGVRFEVEEALASGRDALDLARRLGAPHLEAMAWIVIGQAHAAAAKRTEAEAAGREALRLAGDDPEVAGLVDGACRALASVVLDDVPAALAQLRTAVAHLRRVDGKTPISPWYLWPLLATLHGQQAEGAQARSETDTPELRVATGFDGLWHLADAAAHGAHGDRESAERATALAEEAFAAAPGFAGYRALAQRLAAPAALSQGWGSPLAWLADAELWFRDHALEAQARACRSLQRRAGVPQRRRGRGDSTVPESLAAAGVTSREYDVLTLLAEGLANGEIASRLYVSLRTVKTHLEHVRVKTGAVSRVELAALARPPS